MSTALPGVWAAGPTRGLLRAFRIGTLGATSMLLATTAHLMGGGQLPSLGVLAVAALAVGLVAVTMTSRRCRLIGLIGLLGAEQAGLHWLFGAAGGGHCSGSAHHAATVGGLSCSAAPMQMADLGPLMVFTHVVAVVVTAWVMTRGEGVVWRLAARIVESAYAAPKARLTARSGLPSAPSPVVAPLVLAFAPGVPRGPPGTPA